MNLSPTSPAASPPRLLKAAALAAGLVFLIGLVQFAASGLLTRYWADDYCYGYTIRQEGFLRGPIDWYLNSGNRFSTILLVGLQELLGMGAIRWITAFVLLSLVLGWLVLLRQMRLSWAFAVPLALAQVYFLALLAPDRLQSLYWRMGTLHYTFPLALLLCSAALTLAWFRREGQDGWRAAGTRGRAAALFALAFFACGFSETFSALQVGLFLLALAGALVLLPRQRNGRAVQVLLPGLLGGLAAMLAMLLSPSNAWRQAALPPPSSLGELIFYTLRYSFDFSRDTLRGQPLPLLVLGLSSGLLAYGGFWRIRTQRTPAGLLLLGALGCLAAGLLLACASIAPSVYAGLQYPAGRALMPGRFALLIGISGCAAWLAGLLPLLEARILNAGVSARLFPILVSLGLLTLGLYPLRGEAAVETQRKELAAWAQRWDGRNSAILQMRGAGQVQLTVREVEVVSGLEDLGPVPGSWVNRCAAAYYQVQSITALP